jgi:hypothetical protein
MGWSSVSYREPGMSHAEFFSRELLGSGSRIVESAYGPGQGQSVFYAAVETETESGTEVWAMVVLTHGRAGASFSWKAMDETVGPCEDQCPARVLDRLTPTKSRWASEWRARCRERIAQLERVAPGHTLVFSSDFLTPSGPFRRFELVDPGKGLFLAEDGVTYRLVDWKSSIFSVEAKGRPARREPAGS